MPRNNIIILFLLLIPGAVIGQYPRFSLSTEVGVQQNFKREQRYFVVGHHTAGHFHLSQKDGVFASFAYYGSGRYANYPTAIAKSGAVNPQQFQYINRGQMRVKEFSVGYRKYLAGNFEEHRKLNVYGSGAFGLMFGKVTNTHNVIIDTNFYTLPVHSGFAKFKRLTLDLAIGAEHYVGGDFYFFGEARVYIPTTDYPSRYLFVNSNAPMMGMLGVGFRLLF